MKKGSGLSNIFVFTSTTKKLGRSQAVTKCGTVAPPVRGTKYFARHKMVNMKNKKCIFLLQERPVPLYIYYSSASLWGICYILRQICLFMKHILINFTYLGLTKLASASNCCSRVPASYSSRVLITKDLFQSYPCIFLFLLQKCVESEEFFPWGTHLSTTMNCS